MATLRRLVLDVLKPHHPDVVVLAERLADLEGVDAVNVSLCEIDHRVENAKVTIQGSDIPSDAVRRVVADLGGAVHSVDEVVAGAHLVEAAMTLQD